MKAALLRNWGELELVEQEIPVPDQTQALLKVIYGGVCGSDITVYTGNHMTARAPVVMCHEILGKIEKLPADYSGPFKCGQRVTVNPVLACGECAACRKGFYNACSNLRLLGIHENGGFEQYVAVPTDNLAAVADELPDTTAALSEPFAVGYHVNRRAGTCEEKKVLVVGAGTIGMVVALVAREFGADVYISEAKEERLEVARSFGFETVNASNSDVIGFMEKVTDHAGFDIVIDAAGAKISILQLPDLCCVGGTILSLGLSGAAYEFVIGKVSFKEQTLIGSRLYSSEDFKKGVRALESLNWKYNLLHLISDYMELKDIQQAIDKMMNRQNVGKILIDCK